MIRETLLVLCMSALCQLGAAQWRPSYHPNTPLTTITNDRFTSQFQYTQWQGYFLNTVVIPAGEECASHPALSCSSGKAEHCALVPCRFCLHRPKPQRNLALLRRPHYLHTSGQLERSGLCMCALLLQPRMPHCIAHPMLIVLPPSIDVTKLQAPCSGSGLVVCLRH